MYAEDITVRLKRNEKCVASGERKWTLEDGR